MFTLWFFSAVRVCLLADYLFMNAFCASMLMCLCLGVVCSCSRFVVMCVFRGCCVLVCLLLLVVLLCLCLCSRYKCSVLSICVAFSLYVDVCDSFYGCSLCVVVYLRL